MRKRVSYSFVLFLYAYLRQIDLSLDRSVWTSWEDFTAYFSNQIQPRQVIIHMTHEVNNNNINNNVGIYKTLYRLFKRNFSLTVDQVEYLTSLLNRFSFFLRNDRENYGIAIQELRLDIAIFYSEKLEKKLTYRDTNRAIKVEHYFQNERITTNKITDFINTDLYNNLYGIKT